MKFVNQKHNSFTNSKIDYWNRFHFNKIRLPSYLVELELGNEHVTKLYDKYTVRNFCPRRSPSVLTPLDQ